VIVESPRDAIQTFFTSGLDDLVKGNCVVSKKSEIDNDDHGYSVSSGALSIHSPVTASSCSFER
jgi:hypothetical protein